MSNNRRDRARQQYIATKLSIHTNKKNEKLTSEEGHEPGDGIKLRNKPNVVQVT